MPIATDFYAKYDMDDYNSLPDLIEAVEIVSAENLEWSEDYIQGFIKRWIDSGNIVTLRCFLTQVVKYVMWQNDLPEKFVRNMRSLEEMASYFGFVVSTPNLVDYHSTLRRIAGQLNGLVSDMNGEIVN